MKADIQSYLLKVNHIVTVPQRVLYLDTETKGVRRGQYEVHRFKLGWTCFVDYNRKGFEAQPEWIFFDDAFKMNKYIESLAQPKKALWVYGHNIYFDLQAAEFYYYFSQFGWQYRFHYDSGLTYILCIAKGTKSLKAVSSTNYYDFSLKKLGEMIGLEKLNVDLESCPTEKLADYCRRDVEILKKGMEYYFQFVVDNDLGKMALTKSSQAMNAYRHRFMYPKLHRHEDKRVIALEREAYHGGRVECFRFGVQKEQEYVSLDINSMYPFIMKNYPLPTHCIDYVRDVSPGTLMALLKKYSVVVKGVVKTDEPAYGVFNGTKLVFPVGEFETYLCSGGVKYALSKNHLQSVSECAVYEQGYIFGDYVDSMYTLRKKYEKENNLIMSTLAKYLLNCLYGKFGEKHAIEEKTRTDNSGLYKSVEYFDLVENKHWIEFSMFNTTIRKYGQVEGKKSIVSIPAHITEYARFYLWDIITRIGVDKVYYCDTDSVKIRKVDVSRVANLINDNTLGKLKVEKVFTHFVINGAKHYVCDNDIKIKGVPRKAEQIGDYTYKYMSFLRQPSHMKEGVNREYLLRETIKEVLPQYDKGTILPSGKVVPFVFSMSPLPGA